MAHRRTLLETVLTWIFALALVVGAIGAIIVSAAAGLGTAAGLEEEGDFAFTLTTWLFVWGVAGVVMIIAVAIDWCHTSHMHRHRHHHHYRGFNEYSFFRWLWSLVGLFLATAWLIVGQVMLMRAFTPGNSAVYGWSIYVLVLSYLFVLLAAYRISWLIYEFATAITVHRRALQTANMLDRSDVVGMAFFPVFFDMPDSTNA